jgi:tetratricopeptide (TPR) repeat protein
MSGTQFGMRLDLKPLGPIAAPWRLPVCPKCHFVLFDSEIPGEELIRCKQIVQDDAYKQQTGRASYYLLGLLYEGLKKDPLALGHIFLKASWQEESDENKLEDDLKRSLQHFEIFLKEPKKNGASQKADEEDNSYETAQLLKGEILRRLGRFDDAKDYFSGLQQLKAFQGTFLADIVRFEISLCDKKDSKPHEVSEVEPAKNSEPAHAGDGK